MESARHEEVPAHLAKKAFEAACREDKVNS